MALAMAAMRSEPISGRRARSRGSTTSSPRGAPPAPPARATIAVIGAGIVGNCLVGHLADLGWEHLVLIDKGPLPNPGGSTGHASNFIFPTDHNREIAMLTLESQRQYAALGVNTTCGGIEVARTGARMEELRRRMTSARVWGIEAELLSPDEVVAKAPFVNRDVIRGGFYTPSVSVVDSVRAGTIMRERAQAKGVLTVMADTEVVGLEFGRPRIRAVVTARGVIAVEQGGHRLRRLEPAPRGHRRGHDSPHPGRAPDGRPGAHRPPAADRQRETSRLTAALPQPLPRSPRSASRAAPVPRRPRGRRPWPWSPAPTPFIGPTVTARGGLSIQRVRVIHRPNPNTSGGTNSNTSRSPDASNSASSSGSRSVEITRSS